MGILMKSLVPFLPLHHIQMNHHVDGIYLKHHRLLSLIFYMVYLMLNHLHALYIKYVYVQVLNHL